MRVFVAQLCLHDNFPSKHEAPTKFGRHGQHDHQEVNAFGSYVSNTNRNSWELVCAIRPILWQFSSTLTIIAWQAVASQETRHSLQDEEYENIILFISAQP